MPTIPPPPRDAALDASVFWIQHRTELIAGFLILVIGATGFAGYRLYNDHRDSVASALLAGAKTVPEYQQVVDRYPGTPACASAYLLLAETQHDQKNFAEADTTLRTFIDKFPQHELASTAHLAMAANFESMGKVDEALSTLQRVVANYPKSFNAPVALLSQVHLLKAKNQIPDARRVCENLLTQYRDSYLAGEASRQLRMLRSSSSDEKTSQTSDATPLTTPRVSAPPNATPTSPTPAQPKR